MTNDQKLEILAKNQMAIKDAVNLLFKNQWLDIPDDINESLNGEGGVDESLRQAFPSTFKNKR